MYKHNTHEKKLDHFITKWFFRLIILILLSAAFLIAKSFPGFEYGNGIRTGINYKLSKRGYFCKTWEGELSLQLRSQNSNGALVNQIFKYSVSDSKIAEKIDSVSQSGEVVTLVYKEYFLRGWGLGDTSYDIVDVKLNEDKK